MKHPFSSKSGCVILLIVFFGFLTETCFFAEETTPAEATRTTLTSNESSAVTTPPVVAAPADTAPASTPSADTQAAEEEIEDEEILDEESEEASQASFTTLDAGNDKSGESSETSAPSLGLDERVSLDLKNIEVSEALRYLALKSGVNLSISNKVSGNRTQLLLSNVPIRDVLDIVLITNGLAMEKRGEVYNIMTEQEYKERHGRKFSDVRRVKFFKIKYANPEQVFSLFDVLKSEIGRLLVDPDTGLVLAIDSEETLARMEQALSAMEERKTVKVYELKYAKAIDVETRLKARLDAKKLGSAAADERTNKVIVETLPDRIAEVDAIVEAMDQKTREVLIDTKIVKVLMTNSDVREIKWEGLFSHAASQATHFIGSHPFEALGRSATSFVDDFVRIEPTTTPTAGAKTEVTESVYVGTVGEDAFEAMIKYLKQFGETKILSNPKLVVINNQEAKIHVGEKQAYITTTTTTGQSTATTAEAVTFVDVGIQLSVTPTINEDGFVTMKIKPEISSVTSFLTTPSGNKIPIIDSSLAETTVMVKDGVSIIIGGLKKDEKVGADKKIPFLGDVPILGAPFKSSSKSTIHTELMIIMTPHIIYGDTMVDNENRPAGDSPFMTYEEYPIYEPSPNGVPGVQKVPVSVSQ